VGVRAVASVNRPITLYFGPEFILLALEVGFSPGIRGDAVPSTIERIEHAIRGEYPNIQRIYIEAEALRQHGQSLEEQDLKYGPPRL
jgi:divalent metal cation (Fe/Co/Zn/Cd) transporter